MDAIGTRVKEILDREILERRLAAGYSLAMRTGAGANLALYSGGASFKESTAPYDGETRFNLASTTKPFTSALILKLCEEFGVRLGDRVRKYIPEYPFDDVTLLMLMTHTAGYSPESLQGASIEIPFGRPDAKAYLQSLYGVTRRGFEPGAASMYFSAGYTMLMDVIERVTGGGIEVYARANLFDPLGMDDTTYEIRTVDRWRIPLPTNFAADGSESADERWADLPALGEGNITSTTADLLKFGRMVLDGGVANGRALFHEESARRFVNDATGGKFYHTGVFMCRGSGEAHPTCFSDEYSPNAVAHAGFCGTMLWVEPALDMTAAILTNSTRVGEEWYSGRGNLMWRISTLLRDVALGKEVSDAFLR